MTIRLTALCVAVLMSACATTTTPYPQAYHTQVIQTWVGQDVATLWESWGPPVRSEVASNGYEYQVYQQRIPKPAGPSSSELDLAFAKSSDPNCLTYFIVDPKAKQIRAAHWRGRSCPVAAPGEKALLPKPMSKKIPEPTGF